MKRFLLSDHFDLVSPDGKITHKKKLENDHYKVHILIENISPFFVGFAIDPSHIIFNLKSTLAQLGVETKTQEVMLDKEKRCAEVKVDLFGIDAYGKELCSLIQPGAYIGKLFAQDDRRIVRDPYYLFRMFGRSDRYGDPLLSLGGLEGSTDLILEKIEGKTVAFLSLQKGTFSYDNRIRGFFPILEAALHDPKYQLRSLLSTMQKKDKTATPLVKEGELLLVKTAPLHLRTVFAQVVKALLPQGYEHTSASVLEPSTRASGDVYEFYGSSDKVLNDIPLEFYTLEPHREHVFFSDRDQLQSALEDPQILFRAYETAPKKPELRSAAFIVKGEHLLSLKKEDWVTREFHQSEFPGLIHPPRQALMVERYIQEQPSFPLLEKIEKGEITSQGVLLVRYLPSPLMKRMFLSHHTQSFLKGIYFQQPSQTHGDYFSHEDRSLLLDLAKFAIPAFWVDTKSNKLLQFTPRPEKDCGMFVPPPLVETFSKATFFGIYGSNLVEGSFEHELRKLLSGIKQLQQESTHPLFNSETPPALVTGGGPGAMELGNRIAKELDILSCANLVDFKPGKEQTLNEQSHNTYIDAKMTYRIDKLVERQAEFHLDFPILVQGGIGTDFEYTLEEVRRKVAAIAFTPVLLFGTKEYWEAKITSRYQCNLKAGTINGSEWVSNCFYCVQTAEQALKIYKDFLSNTLPIGPNAPAHDLGFVAKC